MTLSLSLSSIICTKLQSAANRPYQSSLCLKDTISLLFSVAPPQPPAEDVDRYRRRFNMRMLVPGRPVKETPATPPPVPTERPAYREKFIPPELSMWDYFVAKVSSTYVGLTNEIGDSYSPYLPFSFIHHCFLPLSPSYHCQTATLYVTQTKAVRRMMKMTTTPSFLTPR